jgi:predicted metal-dependent RNase
MATGGRILHHLEHLLPDRRNTVALVGFAAATRGRELTTGARQLKIHGRCTPVRAEVVVLDAFSGTRAMLSYRQTTQQPSYLASMATVDPSSWPSV